MTNYITSNLYACIQAGSQLEQLLHTSFLGPGLGLHPLGTGLEGFQQWGTRHGFLALLLDGFLGVGVGHRGRVGLRLGLNCA